jgi:dephospho-CoA kinase
MFNLANSLRALHGPSWVTDQLFLRAAETGTNCIIESIRTPGEILSLRKSSSFYLFAVDADARVRYDRIRRRQSETDSISFETFCENEQREMTTDDPNKQNLHECISMADFVFSNNGNREELFLRVEEVLASILKG